MNTQFHSWLGNCIEDPETSSSGDSTDTCLLKYLFASYKSDCFTASRLMADFWRLDIVHFTPLSHLFRVALGLAINIFTFLWSRHNSFAISVDYLPSARQRTTVLFSSLVRSVCLPIFSFASESDLICIIIWNNGKGTFFKHPSQIIYCQILFILTPKADHSKTQLL